MKNIVILCGISGSGKSTWAKKYIEESPNCIYLNADTMRLAITGDESSQDKNYQVFQTLENMARYFMTLGKSILVDNCNYDKRNRSMWNKLAAEYDYRKTWVVFLVNLEQCIENNKKRTRQVPETVIKKQFDNFTIPLDEGGEIVYVEGN